MTLRDELRALDADLAAKAVEETHTKYKSLDDTGRDAELAASYESLWDTYPALREMAASVIDLVENHPDHAEHEDFVKGAAFVVLTLMELAETQHLLPIS